MWKNILKIKKMPRFLSIAVVVMLMFFSFSMGMKFAQKIGKTNDLYSLKLTPQQIKKPLVEEAKFW